MRTYSDCLWLTHASGGPRYQPRACFTSRKCNILLISFCFGFWLSWCLRGRTNLSKLEIFFLKCINCLKCLILMSDVFGLYVSKLNACKNWKYSIVDFERLVVLAFRPYFVQNHSHGFIGSECKWLDGKTNPDILMRNTVFVCHKR